VRDWSDYRYFLALARAGTLAGAARELGVEHTTVSRRIAALEGALGAKLFVRTPDGFVLTAAGEDALPRIEEAARAIEAVESRVGGEDSELRGKVRITASDAFSGFILRRLGPLRVRYPEVVVEFLTGNQFYDLARREADLAVRIAPRLATPDLIGRKIADCGWGLYATESYLARVDRPLSDGFPGHDVIAYDAEHAFYPGAEWLAANAGGANVVMQGNNIVAVLNAATIGVGIAALPCFLADVEATLRRVRPDVIASRPMWLVVHPDLAKVARVRVVMDCVVEMMAAEAALLSGRQ
jgi:DNA-binding transcriptional LysR family regulator